MKILHLDDERWDSGLTHYALEIATLLQNAGHKVVFGARKGGKPDARARSLGLDVATFASLPSLATLVRSQPWDVINAHTGRMHSWSLVFCGRATRVIRTRGDAREPRSTPFDKLIYGRTAGVITASDHIAKMCQDHLPLPDSKLHVIYPGFEPAPVVASPASTFGILGRLDPVKGHSTFLEAAALVLKQKPEARFQIAGAEAGLRFDLLRNQIEVLGLQGAVRYLGKVPSALSFMQSCTVGVIASLGSEEISRACLEWMAASRPVIGTLVGCLPELIEPSETGLIVSPNDSSALAEAMLTCLNNPDQTRKWGDKARERLERHFSPAQQLQQTLAVYGEGAR